MEKAAECDRAIRISTDPVRKDVLRNLQEMRIILSDKRFLLTGEERDREAEKIARLYELFGGAASTH